MTRYRSSGIHPPGSFSKPRSSAFTLIEVLVALAITLLMMAALAQSYSRVGRRIQSGRAEVELSGRARAAAQRLRDELRRVTAHVNRLPPHSVQSGGGYFLYHEGPLSDASSALYGPNTTNSNGEVVYSSSRYGDIDDYVAFTIQAPQGSWFSGKVPRFIIDPLAVDNTATPDDERFTPEEITSQFAEVAYWVSPEWDRDPTGALLYSTTGHVPVFVDNDGTLELDGDPSADGNDNGFPDRLVLRRRIMLIRPDLNLRTLLGPAYPECLPTPNQGTANNYVPTSTFWLQQYMPVLPPSANPHHTPNWNNTPEEMFNSRWLIGMSLAYQMCDLSVGRRLNVSGRPIEPDPSANTLPESGLQANSLADLSLPHNRFAHVRIPGEYFGAYGGTTGQATSMPLLALTTGAAPFLTNTASIQTTPINHLAYPNTTFDLSSGSAGVVSMPLMNGFVLPQFELRDSAALNAVVIASSGVTKDVRWDRTGEDIVATDVTAFDLQTLDPTTFIYLSTGGDGQPGTVGFDDDDSDNDNNPQTGYDDSATELGATGSDDFLVSVDDPGIYSVLTFTAVNPQYGVLFPTNPATTALTYPTYVERGTYVDLGYGFQAGGNLRDFLTNGTKFPTTGALGLQALGVISTFSGLQDGYRPNSNGVYTPRTLVNSITENLRNSGRVMYNNAGGRVLTQVAWDTSTDYYESDGCNQEKYWVEELGGASGVSPMIINYRTLWRIDGTGVSDEAVDGLDGFTDNFPGNPTGPLPKTTGVDDDSEKETAAPFNSPLKALRVRLRLEDSGTRQLKQLSIIHDFPE